MDRELAKASLISKTRTEENQRKDLDFLKRYSSIIFLFAKRDSFSYFKSRIVAKVQLWTEGHSI
ncbi:hypothetical protein BpHYR1_004656 [Brachionus plicatilis]|uniref:Uncharacterized protein n=1 Tax=Brachionus plicatilis TaxID=10195 RepID=A0A3M7S7A9_BRAPC|nr:hypothetical protein BpHYR1_004656 [Brachionus plicatilis]